MSIARKPSGQWYAVVLKVDDAPPPVYGLLQVEGTFPRPELGTSCVCCDLDTKQRGRFDPRDDISRGDAIEFPLCERCESHVHKDNKVAGNLTLAGAFGLGLIVMGYNRDLWALVAVGIVVCAALAGWLVSSRAKRRRHAVDGHHVGLEITVKHGMCTVRTTNPRLANEIAARNSENVVLAR